MDEIKKVCIIDDDPNIIEIYSTKFLGEGFTVVVANDGEEGVSLVQKEKPDIIILDIMMPKKNGTEVLQELGKNPETSRIPVIILSNVSDQKIIDEIGQFSTHFYAVKSLITPQKVVSLAKEALYGEK